MKNSRISRWKILLSLCIATSVTFSLSPVTHAVADDMDAKISEKSTEVYTEMDAMDMMISAYRFMAATSVTNDLNKDENFWRKTTGVKSFYPLYDSDNNLIAFYVSFKPKGYVIVNNNTQNPVVLEYSDTDEAAEKLLARQTVNSKAIYGISSADISQTSIERQQVIKGLKDFYADNASINSSEQSKHQVLKNLILTSNRNKVSRYPGVETAVSELVSAEGYSATTVVNLLAVNYNIFTSSQLPSGSYTSKYITSALNVHWGTTGEFDGVNNAVNHCGATAAFNVVNYYKTRYNRAALFISNDRKKTFTGLHKKIGSGPVMIGPLERELKAYVVGRGSSFSGGPTGGYSGIKTILNSNDMAIVLLSAGLINYHYVNAIGWREYSSGSKYLRIVNGWDNTTDKYILSTNHAGSVKARIS